MVDHLNDGHDAGATGSHPRLPLFGRFPFGKREDACQVRMARRSPLGRVCLGAAYVLLIFGFVAVAAVGTLYVRLAQGPIVIAGLNERIAAELGARLGSAYRVELGASTIDRGGGGLRLSLAGLSVRGADGVSIFAAPRAAVSIAIAPLLTGSIRPTRIELFEVELGLTVREDGALALSAGADPIVLVAPGPAAAPAPSEGESATPDAVAPPPGPAHALAPVAHVVSDILNALSDEGSPISRMTAVGIGRSRLKFEDLASGRRIAFDNVELGFERRRGVADLRMAADGPNGRWQALAHASGAGGPDRSFEVEIRDLSFDEVALLAGMHAPDFFFDTPLSAKVSVNLDTAGALTGARARFNVGAGGFFTHADDVEPVFVDQIAGGVRWDAATRKVDIETTSWIAGETRIQISGEALPPETPGAPWRIEARAETGSVLGPERAGDAPVVLDRSSIAVELFPAVRRVVVEALDLQGADINATLSGSYDWSELNRRARLNIVAGRMPMRSLLRVWPGFIAPPTHEWLVGHVRAGTVEQGTFALDYDGPELDNALRKQAPSDGALQASFTISNATLDFLPGVPPLAALDVVGHVTGHTVTINGKRGVIEGAAGHKMTFSDAVFAVQDTTLVPSSGQLNARLAGTLDSLIDILSREGMRPYVGQLGDTSAIKGQIDGRLIVDLKLQKKSRQEDTQVQANASVTDLTIDRLIGKERFEQGQLTVVIDRAGLRASGAGRLFGGPAQIEFHKPPVGVMDASVAFAIDDAARARVAPVFATGVSGPIIARVSSTITPKEQSPAHVELDFTRTAIDNALPGLVKPLGRPAKATFRVTQGADGARLDQLVFDANSGASMRGALDLDPTGALRSARMSQMRLSPGDDMKVDADFGHDTLKLVVRGQSVDVRPFLRGIFGPDGNKEEKARDSLARDIDLDLKSALVTGNNKQSMSGVDARMTRRGGTVRMFQLQARSGRATVTASTAPDRNGVPTISINSSDGGSLLSFVDLYRRMEGGRLRASIQLGESGVQGGVFISDFLLRDEPALRRLVSESVPNQEGAPARKIDTTAVPFQRLSSNFSRVNGNLAIRDGVLYGTQIGIKMGGSLDYARDRVEMSGTFVPVYGLNNLFTQIPLVGPILSGGNHEGLFAVNFRVTGPATQPSLVVNPLSAIAPGFLRKMFGAGGPGAPTGNFTGEDAPTATAPSPQDSNRP